MPKPTPNHRTPTAQKRHPSSKRQEPSGQRARGKQPAATARSAQSSVRPLPTKRGQAAAATLPSLELLMLKAAGDEVRQIQQGYMHLAELWNAPEHVRNEAVRAQKLLLARESALTEYLLSFPARTPDHALTQIDQTVLTMDSLSGEGGTSSANRRLGTEAARLLTATATLIARSSGLDLARYTFSGLNREQERLFSSPDDKETLSTMTPKDVLNDIIELHPKLQSIAHDPDVPEVHHACLERAARVLASAGQALCDLLGLALDQPGWSRLSAIWEKEFPTASRDHDWCMSLGME